MFTGSKFQEPFNGQANVTVLGIKCVCIRCLGLGTGTNIFSHVLAMHFLPVIGNKRILNYSETVRISIIIIIITIDCLAKHAKSKVNCKVVCPVCCTPVLPYSVRVNFMWPKHSP